jgi:hypothetical protein
VDEDAELREARVRDRRIREKMLMKDRGKGREDAGSDTYSERDPRVEEWRRSGVNEVIFYALLYNYFVLTLISHADKFPPSSSPRPHHPTPLTPLPARHR